VETDPDKPSPGWLAAERDADVTLWLPGGEGRAEVPMFFRRVPPMDVWSGEGESPLFRIGERGSGNPAEEPVHHVRLERPFYLATFPVTQAQWRGVAEHCGLDRDPSEFKGDFHPMVPSAFSWISVTTWCEWFIENRGSIRVMDSRGGNFAIETLRLPCEAEWEIACRAGTPTEFGDGDGPAGLDGVGWFQENSGGNTQVVGGKSANPWGLYDLHGNVWEWCEDVWDRRAYSKREEGWMARAWTDDDAGSDSLDWGEGTHHVVRGGSERHQPQQCRSSSRSFGPGRSSYGTQFIESPGFRPVLLVPTPIGSCVSVPTEPG